MRLIERHSIEKCMISGSFSTQSQRILHS